MRLLFLLLILFSSISINAQELGETIVLKPKNGPKVEGELKSIDANQITILINKQEVKFLRSELNDISIATLSDRSEYMNNAQPFFISTAKNIGKKKSYYRNYMLFVNNFGFGMSDHFDLNAGFEIATLFSGDAQLPILFVEGKYGDQITKNFSMGLSNKLAFNDEGGVLISGIPMTIGGDKLHFTLAPSFAFPLEDFSDPSFIMQANFTSRITSRSRIIVDAGFVEEGTVATIMYEYIFRSGFSLMPGFAFVNDEAAFVPMLSFSIPIGKG